MRIETLAWILLLAAPLSAQTAPTAEALTPRQSLQKTETLFAQGHRFTAEELSAMVPLHDALVAAGDDKYAADLDLLRLGALAAAKAEDDKVRAKKNLADDSDRWDVRERLLRDQGFWRNVRDVGLLTFTASTTATLLLAAIADRDSAILSNNFLSNYSDKNSFNNGVQWAITGSAATMFLSLFPLLWGEARQ